MKELTVACFGHRLLDQPMQIERMMESFVCRLLQRHEFVEFLIGRDGEFDLLAASVIRRCKHSLGNHCASLVWVMAYPTSAYKNCSADYERYYDEIEVCFGSAITHHKDAFSIRNRNMVDRSDLVLLAVNHANGGAYQAMRYAQQQNKPTVNLFDCTAV